MSKKRLILFLRHHLAQELILLCFAVFAFAAGTVFLWVSTFKIPDLSSFETRRVSQSTKIYDRTGTVLLYDVNQGIKRTIVADSEISRNIKNATVAIEDSEFYQHHGIKFTSILRAILANLGAASFSQGGSTITQQVVKNSLLTSDKTITRKLKEWILALKLERVLDKAAILDIYLNEAPYGGNIYGIEEASETYFGKKAADLTLGESAYLAALPNAPTYYSPYGNNRDKLGERKNLVLRKMLDNKFISADEYAAALKEQVTFTAQADSSIKAPHFVMFVKQYLEEKYGPQIVAEGGLKVITTLDYNLEAQAETILKQAALENEKNFNAENASLVAIDPKTGQILAMVGSRDYFDKKIDGNFNVAIAHRQPGSSFKPFVYSEAFNKGYTPDTTVFDLQTEFSTECNPDGTPIVAGNEAKCYMPENYDGKYLGPITFREALAQSRNIPAIKVLYLAGLKDSLRLAKDFGIESLSDADQYGLTLVLGGGEVSLLDMASAYGVFANDGVRNPYQAILEVDDKAGTVLESYNSNPTQIIPAQTARRISSILSDDNARAPEFGVHSALYFDNATVAVKTGTTNDYRDAWVLGYTPNIVIGAWAGNNDNRPMVKKIAGFIVAPMWHTVVAKALETYPPAPFHNPDPIDETVLKPPFAGLWQGGQAYFVDKLTGELATEYTPADLKEERVVRQVHSILYWVDKSNPLGMAPVRPEDDPQFKLWEYPVQKWTAAQELFDQSPAVIPTALDSVHGPQFSPKLTITNPSPTLTYDPSGKIVVMINATGSFPLAKADFFVNGIYVGSSNRYPFSFAFVPNDLSSLLQENELKVVGYDSMENRGEAAVTFSTGAGTPAP